MSENKKITFDQLVSPLAFRGCLPIQGIMGDKEQRRSATDYAKLYIFAEGLMAENSAL